MLCLQDLKQQFLETEKYSLKPLKEEFQLEIFKQFENQIELEQLLNFGQTLKSLKKQQYFHTKQY
jgi:hypothetical protein